jgi:hypothetical protein
VSGPLRATHIIRPSPALGSHNASESKRSPLLPKLESRPLIAKMSQGFQANGPQEHLMVGQVIAGRHASNNLKPGP